MYILRREQILHTSIDHAWDFLKNPHNLNHITPPELNFTILSDVPEEMYNGLIIEYRLRIPYIGQQRWVTEIKHIREHHSFVDEQRIGPYRFWYHHHELEEISEGVISRDTVYYLPPYGPLGRLLHSFYICNALKRIFDYRTAELTSHFRPESQC